MKKKYSVKWQSSSQPRKQRKFRYNAPLHKRTKMMSSHLAKDLRVVYQRRSLPLRKGDEVRIMKGEHRGRTGKVERIDLQKLRVHLENVKIKKTSGQEMAFGFDPSNLLIVKAVTEDKKRIAAIKRGKQ